MAPANGILEQLRRNTIALISLMVAVSSLSYNTWRNEQTEENRNQRFAAFEILLKLGQLQEIVFLSHYDMDTTGKGNPRTGWAYVLTVRDLTDVLPVPLQTSADELVKAWDTNWRHLGEEESDARAITAQIDSTRDIVLQLLKSLQ